MSLKSYTKPNLLKKYGLTKEQIKDIDTKFVILPRKWVDEHLCDVWCPEDVMDMNPGPRKRKITRRQAIEILNAAEDNHDACIGINWDVLDCHIDMYFGGS